VRLRATSCVLLATALIITACSSTSPSSTAPGASGSPGSTASGSLPPGSTPGSSGSPGATASPGAGETATANPTRTPKPPKPLDDYVTHGPRKGDPKRIALTFDADMYPFMYANIDNYTEYDQRVIKLIEDNNLHATIFANGLYVKAYPDLIKELSQQEGIEIANHSWDHGAWPGCASRDPAAPPVTDKKGEITKAAKIIEDTVGYAPDWFRFGGFCYGGDNANLDLVKAQGEWPIGNDCFFGDSAGWTAQQQISNVQNTCKNGSIVVTHLNNTKYHPNIYQALKELIPWWKDNGWEVVNVTELLGQGPPEP
jgi:peptidoglycan/xylan/chitin deacetylase (PgdA/CDA1 family)